MGESSLFSDFSPLTFSWFCHTTQQPAHFGFLPLWPHMCTTSNPIHRNGPGRVMATSSLMVLDILKRQVLKLAVLNPFNYLHSSNVLDYSLCLPQLDICRKDGSIPLKKTNTLYHVLKSFCYPTQSSIIFLFPVTNLLHSLWTPPIFSSHISVLLPSSFSIDFSWPFLKWFWWNLPDLHLLNCKYWNNLLLGLSN